ncbi:hypothetical protein PVAG01_03758 [Phlyctema vagabunda]|uniref:Uncharacterized protein n=1 Tax=Phlyctema vagabunda TaxID=108571 RepID=A0ABR4PMZ7_9HELO
MDTEEEENGLFNINLSDSESSTSSSSPSSSKKKKKNREGQGKHPRDYQSPASFTAHKESWTAKVEIGQIWKTLDLPIQQPSKPQSQTILHAVEELYFTRAYAQARAVVRAALDSTGLDQAFRTTLEAYEVRCEVKLAGEGEGEGNGRGAAATTAT